MKQKTKKNKKKQVKMKLTQNWSELMYIVIIPI